MIQFKLQSLKVNLHRNKLIDKLIVLLLQGRIIQTKFMKIILQSINLTFIVPLALLLPVLLSLIHKK